MYYKKQAVPAGDILLFIIIFLWWLWSSSRLVLLHYPHTSCLNCNTDVDTYNQRVSDEAVRVKSTCVFKNQ